MRNRLLSRSRAKHNKSNPRVPGAKLQLEALEGRLAPAVLMVTTTQDDLTPNDGTVSLREALTAINVGNNLGDPDIIAQNPGSFGTQDAIHFQISGSGPFVINVGSAASALNVPLPQIVKPVVIDATTQSGFTSAPIVVLNGTSAGAGAIGLDINSGGVTVQGFVIQHFASDGIRILANDGIPTGDMIAGNFIGTNASGTAGVGNMGAGIRIVGTGSNATGTAASNNVIKNNVISGNADGVSIGADSAGVASGNVLFGNRIGTSADGTAAIPNTGNGVVITGASGNQVGQAGQARNLISGNAQDGVLILGTLTAPANANSVANNFIGVNVSGNFALATMQRDGIELSGATNTSVGGNVIGANTTGIELDNGAQNNVIQGNFVGLGADGSSNVGNPGHGIVVRSSDSLNPPAGPGQPNEPGVRNNLVGGTGAGDGNTIAFSGNAGVAVFGNPVSLSGQANTGNAIEGNSIYRNGRNNPSFLLGIDLTSGFAFPTDDGVTPNDSKGHGTANDPNNFQNFPVLNQVTLAELGGTRVRGFLSQAVSPNTKFRLEFFSSNLDPANGIAEGQFFLGAVNQTTDGAGNVPFDVLVPFKVSPGQLITATATDPAGNTSEFSAAVGLTGLVATGSMGQGDPTRFPVPISVNGAIAVVDLKTNGTTLGVVKPFAGFTGEVHRAVGDLNGDGVPDVVYAAGAGTGSHVKVVDGKTGATLASFDAFGPGFTGGVYVALADVNGDGVLDVIVGAGAGGGPQVKVIDGTKLGQVQANGEIADSALLASFYAFDPAFRGGVRVAAADFDLDGHADIIAGAGMGGGPQVLVLNGVELDQKLANGQIAASAVMASFYAYVPQFSGGVFVSAGDFNGDHVADIITGAGFDGGPHVKVVNGVKLAQIQANGQIADSAVVGQFYAFDPTFAGGVRVDAVDVNGDQVPDVITGAGPGGGPEVKAVDGTKTTQIQGNGAISAGALLADFLVDTSGSSGLPPAPPPSGFPTALTLRNPTFNGASNDLYGPTLSNIPQSGRAVVNDLFVFRSPAETAQVPNFGNTDIMVTLSPFAGSLTPVAFDPRVTLDVNVVNVSGHLTPDMTFRFTFAPPTPAGATFNQVVTVRLLQGNTTTTIAEYTYAGNQTIPPAAFPNNVTFPGDAIAVGRFIAGDFANPAFIDASGFNQFALTGNDPAHPFPRPAPLNPSSPSPTEAKNFFHQSNILGIVLEAPTTKFTTANPPLLGVWTDTFVNGVQVQRLGRALVDGAMIPALPRNDLSRGDRRTAFNQGSPNTDVANFRADMIAVLTNPNFIYHQTQAQAAALTDSVFGASILGQQTGFLPDILTVDLTRLYNDATNGYPNGRRLRDNVTDETFRLLTGNPSFTDNVTDDNAGSITDGLAGSSTAFPYIGMPNSSPGGPNP
jgi:parallel beta-helix repeat protein